MALDEPDARIELTAIIQLKRGRCPAGQARGGEVGVGNGRSGWIADVPMVSQLTAMDRRTWKAAVLLLLGSLAACSRPQAAVDQALAEYRRCNGGARECYYAPANSPGVLLHPPRVKDVEACYRNTRSMRIDHFANSSQTVFRCEFGGYVGEYRIVEAPRRKYLMTTYAFGDRHRIGAGVGVVDTSTPTED